MTDYLTHTGLVALHLGLLSPLLWPGRAGRWPMANALLLVHMAVALTLWISPGFLPYLTSPGALGLTLWLLVSVIGLVVLNYARRSLHNDPDQPRFLASYLTTLCAVFVTVTSQHLLVLAAGWIAINLSVHRLLLFYPDRPRAQLAAHKRFLFSRLAEATLVLAAVLLYWAHGDLTLAGLMAHYQAAPALTPVDQLAALLIAATALISCAQLPVHGWLIQVVEAPTPVSALLHAGIINLGGFLLLAFAPLLSAAGPARWLLLVVAGLTAVLAALIMITRISIKVRLAWSTVAQMGLMLCQCALGLYELALLHLLAHSAYKAHAFLGSGETVNHYLREQRLAAHLPGLGDWLLAGLLVLAGALTAFSYWSLPASFTPVFLLALAVTTALAFTLQQRSAGGLLMSLLLLAAGAALYLAATGITRDLLALPALRPDHWADLWLVALFAGLFITTQLLAHKPAPARRLWIALNAGLYLDEWATRVTLALWPIHLPAGSPKVAAGRQQTLATSEQAHD